MWLCRLGIGLQIERSPVLFPGQGACLGCQLVTGWGVCQRQPISVSLPLFLPPFPSLKIKRNAERDLVPFILFLYYHNQDIDTDTVKVQNIPITTKSPHVTLFPPTTTPPPRAPDNTSSVLQLYNFVISRMLCKWNDTVWEFVRLASFHSA